MGCQRPSRLDLCVQNLMTGSLIALSMRASVVGQAPCQANFRGGQTHAVRGSTLG